MPVLRVCTNAKIDDEQKQAFMVQASKSVSEALGKPEDYVMVVIKDSAPMIMGASGEKTAFCELKSIGLPDEKCPLLSENICKILEERFSIPKSRTYIEFMSAKPQNWGYNGATF